MATDGNRCDGCMTCTTCDGCYCDEVLRLLDDCRVPFDHNQAQTRPAHGEAAAEGLRLRATLAGAAAFLALRSYVSTARKHGMNPLVVLHHLFEGRPWLRARAGS